MTHTIYRLLQPQTIARAVLVTLLVAVIAPFVVYAVPATVGAEVSYVVLTASMTPAIAPGDVVVVDSVRARDVAVGDVIVFEQQAGDLIPVTHRVIEVDRPADAPPSFYTKGDANEDPDLSPVTPDRLVGRVVFTIPLIGYVVQFVGTPAGFVALVVVPLGLLVVSEVVDLLRAGRSPSPDGAATADVGDHDDTAATEADSTPTDFVWAEWMDAVPATRTATGVGADTPAVDATRAPSATVEDSASDQIVITPADLTLTSAVLGGFLAYAAYVAIGDPTTLSVSIAVAVGALFALTVGVRLYALPDPGLPAETPVRSDGGHTVDGTDEEEQR